MLGVWGLGRGCFVRGLLAELTVLVMGGKGPSIKMNVKSDFP